ncbi:MAG: substrate-binding domain-containing protein, partial [Nocardioidaceae bacterium]|nr:substrate-binding domain-containing protein [Nocardioidaceae bacterium]
VEHLLELGHERIAFVGGPERIGQVRDRRRGARAALAGAGRDAAELVDVATEALSIVEGMNAAERVAGMSAADRPTAVFCANDLLALGVLQRCVALGLRVPDDLALVGYDDIVFAAAAAVPLTSVRQPRREMGRVAAQLLVEEAADPRHEHQQILFEPELVARASTRGSALGPVGR